MQRLARKVAGTSSAGALFAELVSQWQGRGNGTGALCLNHQSSLPVLQLFRQPAVLAAPPTQRARAMHELDGGECAALTVCLSLIHI